MKLKKRIAETKKEIDTVTKKIQQLAQMRDQAIAHQNMLVGKLEAYNELLLEEDSEVIDDGTENNRS